MIDSASVGGHGFHIMPSVAPEGSIVHMDVYCNFDLV